MEVRVRLSSPMRRRVAGNPAAPRSAPQLQPRWAVCWQVLACCVPAAYFIYTGQLSLAGASFYGILGLLAMYYAAQNQIVHMTAVFVGCAPMLMMLRPVFYHNSITVIFGGILLLWAMTNPAEIRHLMRDHLVFPLLPLALAYWWYSFFTTGSYATNLRVFELVFGACLAFLLGRFRGYWAGALWGIGFSTVAIVAAVWRYGADRLGMAEIGQTSLGHPQQVGIASALILTLSLLDDGRWLGLGRSVFWKYVAAAGAVALILLTTSRTTWVLAIVAMSVVLVGRARRTFLIPAGIVLTLVIVGLLATSRGAIILKYFDKAISSERTLSQKTSGRVDMYAAFPRLFWQAPLTGLGPGAAVTAYRDTHGETLQLHSLFLQVGVELGFFGLAIVVLGYVGVLRRTWTHRRITGEVVPLAAGLCCWLDALTHNSFNPLTGVFLGLALTDLSRWQMMRKRVTSHLVRDPALYGRRPASAEAALPHGRGVGVA